MAEPTATHVEDVRMMLRELTVTTSLLHAQADASLSALDQNLSRWQVLHQYASGPVTVPAVARAMNHSRQYVQRITDDMMADGLVVARENPRHRRSPLFEATSAGRDLLDQLEDGVSEWTAYLAETLSDEETTSLRAVMSHLRRATIAYGANVAPRKNDT